MSCSGCDTPSRLLGDDSEEVFDGSQDQDLQKLSIEGEEESCEEWDTA